MQENKEYKNIIKSTSVVGGTQIVNIAIGIFRTKFISLIIGPSGVGLAGILQSIVDLIRSITGFGLNFSGVKQIANSYKDKDSLGKSAIILKKWSIWTGILGTITMLLFCNQLSQYSFGNNKYALNIALISIVNLLTSISTSQLAFLQGIRKIELMSKATLFGSILGTILTLPVYYIWGINAIVPGIIITAICNLICSAYFVKKVVVEKTILLNREIFSGGITMVKLGFFITVSGFLSTITLYFIRALLLKKINLDAVGSFQACWMISNLYLGIILNSMLADFFPRLSEISNNNELTNLKINEQLEITLLIATPAIAIFITFSNLIIKLFYSKSFLSALPILQWQLAGTFFVLVSWPLGVVFLTRKNGVFSLISDLFKSILYVLIIYLSWNYFGFKILGIAYSISSFLGAIFIFICTKYLTGFNYSSKNILNILLLFFLVHLCLLFSQYADNTLFYILNAGTLIFTIIFCYIKLSKLVNLNFVIRTKMSKFKSIIKLNYSSKN